MAKAGEKQERARSSITGRFVSVWYALWHPKTTVIERRKKKAQS